MLVTLERSAEQVYATEGRSSARAESGGSDEEEETTYFSVRGSDGSEQALPVTEVQPVIRGVVIVCPGGGNPAVAERITRAVTIERLIFLPRVYAWCRRNNKEKTGG